MSKRRYQAKEVNQIHWSEVATKLANQVVVMAIDVAKEKFVAALMVAGEIVLRMKWTHPKQTGEWLKAMELLLSHTERLETVMESSGTYGDAIRWQLEKRGAIVFRVSAKWVHDNAESHDGVPSTHDVKAAEIIADLHLRGRSERWERLSPERRAAQAWSRQLYQAKKRFTTEKNRTSALLARYWLEALTIITMNSRTLYALLERYGSPASIAADRDQAAELMHQVGGVMMAQRKIDALLDSAGQTLGEPCVDAEQAVFKRIGGRLKAIAKEVGELERQLTHPLDTIESAAAMAGVIGSVSAMVLYATQGDPANYKDAHSYEKSLGLNLKEHSSGQYKGQLKLTKRGPSISRSYVFFATLRLLEKEPVVKRWFDLKASRPRAVKMKIVVELMRKLTRALWYIAQGEAFDPERLFV